MKRILILLLGVVLPLHAADLNYQNDFEKAEVGSLPDDFLVIEGDFTVKADGANRVLELPGAPLDSFGLLFGPSAKENVAVSARILGRARGRRYPTFDVGLNGVGGYRLRVSPAKLKLELLRNEVVQASAPLERKPDQWTHLKLTVVKEDEGQWKVTGAIWQEGASEPSQPNISFVDTKAPPNGRPGIYGSPFSGRPIWYDDLKLEPVK